MKKLKNIGKYINKNTFSSILCLFVITLKSDFCNFDIPIAENVPNEIIKLLNSNSKLIFFKVIGNIFSKGINLRYNPFVLNCKVTWKSVIFEIICKIHQYKTSSVPKFICKVT